MRRDKLTVDAPVIIGGGPAGSAAAITLGRAGYRPVVLERASGPADKVCGDFLSVDAIRDIQALGVDPLALGAMPIHRVRLIHGARTAETPLPFPAMGLSRRTLDDALLSQVRDAGSVVRSGQTVSRIDRVREGWMVQLAQGDPVAAGEVFLATGKHDLRAWPRPGSAGGAIGMKMYYDLVPRQTASLAGAIELILFPGGYAGLQCVEGGRAVLCIAVQRQRFQEAGGSWMGLVASIAAGNPHLGDVLAGATALLPRPLAVAGIPYGWLHASDAADAKRLTGLFRGPLRGPFRGPFRLGDQAAVIPSLTGDGIAIALHSGLLAARVWLDSGNALTYHTTLARALRGQMRLARMLHRAGLFGPLQPAAVRGAALFPGLLRAAARGTRIRSN